LRTSPTRHARTEQAPHALRKIRSGLILTFASYPATVEELILLTWFAVTM
jgi:hypothetical protein